MRTRRFRRNVENASYDLSISDLMAALCCIFVLVIVAIVCSLKDKNMLAEKYRQLQNEIFLDLKDEFGDDLKKWDAEIDPDTLTIRFSSDDGFDDGSAELKPAYKKVLQNFFPKLVQILEKDKYKNEIEEIRIEGFTSTDRNDVEGEGSEHDYTTGIKLSQERTQNVLLYCLENTNYSQETDPKKKEEEKDWIRRHIVANGYSLSRPIGKDENGKTIQIQDGRKLTDAEKKLSRRVEFRIKTNSDNIVKQFQKINRN